MSISIKQDISYLIPDRKHNTLHFILSGSLYSPNPKHCCLVLGGYAKDMCTSIPEYFKF